MPRAPPLTFWGWVLAYGSDGSGMAFEKRSLKTDGRTILEMSHVKPASHAYSGIIVPTFEDAHAHLADRKAQVPPGTPLAEVVRPPDGLKHRYLAAAPEDEVVSSIREGVEGLIASGAAGAHEFREGGIAGARMYRKALEALPAAKREHFKPLLLGRPGSSGTRPSDEKAFWGRLRRLLEVCDGVGLSSISDGDIEWNIEVAREVKRQGKRVELHCSEGEREPVERALAAGAGQLVHMVHATPEDLKLVADQRVPVAVCTRSNEFFGLRAPVDLMVEAGVDVRIGTDNAFLGPPDMFEEVRAFARVHKMRASLSPLQILSFLLRRKDINGGLPIAPRDGARPDFLIVTIQTERPDRDLIAKARAEDVAAIVGSQAG